jgi:hypothetical protein
MKRTVVNVSTGRYMDGQLRLMKKIEEFSPESMIYFYGQIPHAWPAHKDKPYAFKAFALKEAANFINGGLVLWADAAVLPVKPLEPIWERIEHEGYWIPLNGWTNYEWTADSAYPDLFPELLIEQAREVNKTVPHCCATTFGLNLDSEVGAKCLEEYYRLANTNAFCGPWSNLNNPNHWNYHPDMMGVCGPPDVLGHRHDQTALSVIAWRLGMKFTQCPWGFAYPPATDDTILLAVGA